MKFKGLYRGEGKVWNVDLRHLPKLIHTACTRLTIKTYRVSFGGTLFDPGKDTVACFLACEDLERMFEPFIPHLRFFFFFKAEISSCTLIPLFMPECPPWLSELG